MQFFDILDKDAAPGTRSRWNTHCGAPRFCYLHALTVPTAVYAASEGWGNREGLVSQIERAAEELADQLAEGPGRKHPAIDEFEDVTPFEQKFAALRRV